MQAEQLIYDYSSPDRVGCTLPECDVPMVDLPQDILREELALPEVSELDVMRHFSRLSHRQFCIDTHFYPLGSCTMKYNPRVNERVARDAGFSGLHPLQSEEATQGALELLYELERVLSEILGMDAVTLQPVAGAQGELAGMLMARAYHLSRGDDPRKIILIPDSAHGTNPATAARCGFSVQKVPSNPHGTVDMDALRSMLGPEIAGLMLTNPNTLGLFEPDVAEICELVHQAGGITYCDGANLNAVLGRARPGDMGFDIVHTNLHKTFSTPHGGGGPGSGPVGVKEKLVPFLPAPIVVESGDQYQLDCDRPQSIGRLHSFYGNFLVMVRAYTYIRSLGADGLAEVSGSAVLNANYLLAKLRGTWTVPYNGRCMHEFVSSASSQKERGVRALDVGKRLLDLGFHAPTVYFPLIVDEALMIEPTESESKETLDQFIEAMLQIDQESRSNPSLATSAPQTLPVTRVDEVTAARRPKLRV